MATVQEINDAVRLNDIINQMAYGYDSRVHAKRDAADFARLGGQARFDALMQDPAINQYLSAGSGNSLVSTAKTIAPYLALGAGMYGLAGAMGTGGILGAAETGGIGTGASSGAGMSTAELAAADPYLTSIGGASGVTPAIETAGMLSAAGAPGVAASTAAGNVATGLGYDMLGTTATGGGMLGAASAASPAITQATQTLAQSGVTQEVLQQAATNPSLMQQISTATGIPTSMLGTIASTALTGLGGYLQGQSATSAAETLAAAQRDAARIAAEAQMLRPMPVKNIYGEFTPTFDAQGRLTGLNTTTADWLAGQQKQLIGMSGTELQRAQDIAAATAPMIPMSQQMFGLSQGYLQTSPQAQAAKYMKEQQALLAPTRERQMAQMLASEQARGTLGLGVGATTTGFGAANPRLEAMLNAQRMQDLGLAAQATQGGMEAAQFGAQMGQAGTQMVGQVGPTAAGGFQAYGTVMRGLEGTQQMAERPMQTSLEWATPATAAAAAAGQAQAKGMLGAAQTMAPANAYNPATTMLSNAGNAITNYQTQQQQQQQQQFQNNLMNQLITGRV